MRKIQKSGQVWIETVIYTLIGLSIIGILLAVSKPKIDSMKDKSIIEQSIETLTIIDNKIYDVQKTGSGNKRTIPELKISKGNLVINAENNSIYWIIDSSYKYSELDEQVPLGRFKVITTQQDPWQVKIIASYDFDLIYNGEDIIKEFEPAAVPYSLSMENMGNQNGITSINIQAG